MKSGGISKHNVLFCMHATCHVYLNIMMSSNVHPKKIIVLNNDYIFSTTECVQGGYLASVEQVLMTENIGCHRQLFWILEQIRPGYKR